MTRQMRAVMIVTSVLVLGCPVASSADGGALHLAWLRGLMRELRPASVQHAASIASTYASEADSLAFADRDALRTALADATLMPMPNDAEALNVAPRLRGAHQLGELDPAHQALYLAGRPETIGMLFDIASRVQSGSLDVTSLVRHAAYQRQLSRRNPNARTDVPTHVMGLAVDISVLNRPARHAREVRDVLRDMAARGDIHVVAEQRHVVFHVVPAAARLDEYREFARSLAAAGSLAALYPWRAELGVGLVRPRATPARPPSVPALAWPDVPPTLRWLATRVEQVSTEGPWPMAIALAGVLGLGSVATLSGRRDRRPSSPGRGTRGPGPCSVTVALLAATGVGVSSRAAPSSPELPPVVSPEAGRVRLEPVPITVTAGAERFAARVSAEDLLRDPVVWRRMHLADWNAVPADLRRTGLSAMVERYGQLLANPAAWGVMQATDWDDVPQPIRTAAYRQMVRYWTEYYRLGSAWHLCEAHVSDVLAAVVMSESWFDHRGLLVNADGTQDLGLAGASAFARQRLRQLHAQGRVDVAFDDGAYLNPWNATRFAALWMGLLLEEAGGDLELAVRAYNRGIVRARDTKGTAYLHAVQRRLRQFVRNEGAPAAWSDLWRLARELERHRWATGPVGLHPERGGIDDEPCRDAAQHARGAI